MEDSQDTVIVTGIDENVVGQDFINFFSKTGEIKTDRYTAQRMAQMRYFDRFKTGTERSLREGIITYANAYAAKEALKTFNDKELKGSLIKVYTPQEFCKRFGYTAEPVHKGPEERSEQNAAWDLWKRGFIARGGRGGRGGTGGGFFFSRGEAGEPGEDGPFGGTGGRGGKAGASFCSLL